MKISDRQLRKIIREEFSRPSSVYTDDDLINEGIFDFLGSLFSGLKDFLSGADQEASGASSDAASLPSCFNNNASSSVNSPSPGSNGSFFS